MPYKPPACSTTIDAVLTDAAERYNLPRWWLYAVCHRESTFDPDAFNPNGGYGLFQLTNPQFSGVVYPENLAVPDETFQQWIWDTGQNLSRFGDWIDMNNVSPITTTANRFDATQNTDRFCTIHAVPGFALMKQLYPSVTDDADLLRRLAFHWNRSIFATYDTNHSYLVPLYDNYVATYQASVEADDGVWNGLPHYEGETPTTPTTTRWGFAQRYNSIAYNAVQNTIAPPVLSVKSNFYDIVASTAPPAAFPHFPSNNTIELRIEVLDENMAKLAEVFDYISLSYKRTFAKGDSFSLMVPGLIEGQPNPLIDHLQRNNFVRVFIVNENETSFEAYQRGAEYMGLINRIYSRSEQNVDTYEVSGQCILNRRIVLPPPSVGNGYYNVNSFSADAAMKVLVDLQVGNLAEADRKINRLFIAAQNGLGPPVRSSIRYDNLVEKLTELAQESGIGWELRPVPQGLEFQTFEGVDRSAQVIFSPQMLNVESMEYESSIAQRHTHAYVAGQGEGADRDVEVVLREDDVSSPPTNIDRSEQFFDARDIDDEDPALAAQFLTNRGRSRLEEEGPIERMEAVILSTGPFRYRVHWDLGDIVKLRHEQWNAEIDTRVMEVEVIAERGRNPVLRAVFGSSIVGAFDVVRRAILNVKPSSHS